MSFLNTIYALLHYEKWGTSEFRKFNSINVSYIGQVFNYIVFFVHHKMNRVQKVEKFPQLIVP